MQVSLQALFHPFQESGAIVIDTNAHATVQTLISTFCANKGISFSQKYAVLDASRRPLPLYNTLQTAGVTSGQLLYIVNTNTYRNWAARWPLYIAIIALIIGLVGILSMSLVYGLSGGVVPFDFGVVIDTGSSKTNSLLYHWRGNKFKGTGCVSQIRSCRVKGGLAKEEDIEEGVKKIVGCVKELSEPITPKSIPETPLYCPATAGMRLLNISDPDKTKEIVIALRTHLNSSGLSVKEVGIISGRDEGIYAWITANFLMETLDVENEDPWTPVTHGALDLGGASTQIAFALPPDIGNQSNPDVQPMELYSEMHYVFAKSYLCFGRDEVARRYRSLLTQNPEEKEIDDPCGPKGSVFNDTGASLFHMPCTFTDKSRRLVRNDASILEETYHFKGTSNYQECISKVARLTDYEACRKAGYKECFQKLPRQLENQKFLAFANYFYTTDFLNLTDSSLEEYENVTKHFCQKSADKIHGHPEFKLQYCFNAVYIRELLLNGYGFNSTTWKNLKFIGQVDDKDLGWSLGYMINATNMIPEKRPTKRLIAPDVLIVCLLLFIVVVVATIIYILQTVCRKKETPDDYSTASYQKP